MQKKLLNNKKRVVVAMSGGVDSSVAAYLLKKEGYDVIGIFLKLWQPSCIGGTKKQNLCCDDKALAVARTIADKLEIPFYVLKVDSLFKKEIVDNFVSEYEKGLTPNPCVRCNRYIKFGYLWQKAQEFKADHLATGHYVKKISNTKYQMSNKIQNPNDKKFGIKTFDIDLKFDIGNLTFNLVRSKDEKKDQTYFLSTIDSNVIPHLLFPLGDMEKKDVREIARRVELPVYAKKDSMGICFIPDGDANSFLKSFTKKLQKSGQIVDKYGNVLGRHEGLLGYTIGQKFGDNEVTANYFKISNDKYQMSNQIQNPNDKKIKNYIGHCELDIDWKLEIENWKLKGNKNVPRLYITAIDIKKNRLMVGENEDCFQKEMTIQDWRQVNTSDDLKVEEKYGYLVQIRGGHKPEKCRVLSVGANGHSPNKKGACNAPLQGEILVEFEKPVRAITPGQTAVIYKKSVLVGGGIIANY